MNSPGFDLTSVIDPIIETIRLRLPDLIAAEVRRQLAAPPKQNPTLTDAELRQRNSLRAKAGLRLLPGVDASVPRDTSTQPRKPGTDVLTLRARKP
jgi:hypothetical protein